jgi:hypothetical protein
MRKAVPVLSAAAAGPQRSQPYPPSWFDRVIAGVDRLPGPAWAFYLGLWLVLFLAETLLKWRDGTYPPGTIFPFHVFYAAIGPYILLALHALKIVARDALHTCRPALTVSEAEYAHLQQELTTAPPRPTLVASLLGLLLYLFWFPFPGNPAPSPLATLKLFTSPGALVLDTLIFIFTRALLGAGLYHILHQLGVVKRIHAAHVRINLFAPGPIYAFSRLTVLTAILLLLGEYLWLASVPGTLQRPTDLALAVFLQLMAIVVFVWPLFGLHRRQVEEKSRLQGEAAPRLAATIRELHHRIDGHALSAVDQDGLNKALDSLLKELSLLDKLPTWPWPPETPRLLATAIVLPVVVWFIQAILGRLLGG